MFMNIPPIQNVKSPKQAATNSIGIQTHKKPDGILIQSSRPTPTPPKQESNIKELADYLSPIEDIVAKRTEKSEQLNKARTTLTIPVLHISTPWIAVQNQKTDDNKKVFSFLEQVGFTIRIRKSTNTTLLSQNEKTERLLSHLKETGEYTLTLPLLLQSADKKNWFLYSEDDAAIARLSNIPLKFLKNGIISNQTLLTCLPLFWPWIINKKPLESAAKSYGDLLSETPLPAPWLIWSDKKKQFIMNPGSAAFAMRAQEAGFANLKGKKKTTTPEILETTAPRAATTFLPLCKNSLAQKLIEIYNRWPFIPQEISPKNLEKLMADEDEDPGFKKANDAIKKEFRKKPEIFYNPTIEMTCTHNETIARKTNIPLVPEHVWPDTQLIPQEPLYGTNDLTILTGLFHLMETGAQCKVVCALIHRSNHTLPSEIKNKYPLPASKQFTYDPSQIVGIQHCMTNPTTMLSDDMGTGKTVQACGLADTLRTIKAEKNPEEPFSALFIIPPDIMTKWAYHAIYVPEAPFHVIRIDRTKHDTLPDDQKKFTTIISPETANRSPYAMPSQGSITLLPFSRIASCPDLLDRKWDVIVTDEGHAISKSSAERTKIFFKENKDGYLKIDTPYFVQMTGTDITNTISDYYYIVRMIIERGNPDIHVPHISEDDFKNIFQLTPSKSKEDANDTPIDTESGETKETRIAELAIALDSGARIRRLKSDIYPDLPPKHPPKTWIIPARTDLKNIEKQQEIMKKLGYIKTETQQHISELAKKQLEEELESSRIETARYKIPEIIKVIKRIASKDEPILLYAHHTEISDSLGAGLAAAGVNVITAHGKNTSPEMRFQIGQEFNQGKYDVLCTTISGFYAGHDTTRTRLVFFAEMDHKSWMISQCQDRSWRRGQKRSVYVRFFVVPHSYDDILARNIIDKTRIHTIASGDDRRIFNASL